MLEDARRCPKKLEVTGYNKRSAGALFTSPSSQAPSDFFEHLPAS
jgi:hypothetical protein